MRTKFFVLLLLTMIMVASLGCLEYKKSPAFNETKIVTPMPIPNITEQVIKNVAIPRKSGEYFRGEAFDELARNFTKNWNAENFAGFWRDQETNVSTESLIINQSTLNNTHRIIEKYNLMYTTKSVLLEYQVYKHANQTPLGTNGFYYTMGWLGEKYVLLANSKLAKIIFEQNATSVKTMYIEDSWSLGDKYRLATNSIDAPMEAQAWITFFQNNSGLDDKLDDRVLGRYRTYSYPENVQQNDAPVFITYLSNIYKLPYTNGVDLKYTWLRSQSITEIKEGDIFGIMEATFVKNGTIELRNREQIDLIPGTIVNMMGDVSIQIEHSKAGLLFYPTMGKQRTAESWK